MTCTVVLIEPVVEACRAPVSSASLYSHHKSLRKRASDVEDKEKQQEQQEVHHPASCMSDYSPLVWNPQTQRYDLRRLHVTESQHQQQHQLSNSEDQQYNPIEVPAQRPVPTSAYPEPSYQRQQESWNPWAYLESGNQRPYTPTQPAVGAGSGLPDLPSQYDQYRGPAGQAAAFTGLHDPQDCGFTSHYRSGTAAQTSSQQQRPSYQSEYEYGSTHTYSGWQSSTQTFLPQSTEASSSTLPPPVSRLSPITSTSVLGSPDAYTSTSIPSTSSITNKSGPSTYAAYLTSPHTQTATGFSSYADYITPELPAGPAASTSEATSGQLAPTSADSNTFLEWIAFQDLWRVFIRNHERILSEQAARGELPGFVPQKMAQPAPTFASCEVSLICLTLKWPTC